MLKSHCLKNKMQYITRALPEYISFEKWDMDGIHTEDRKVESYALFLKFEKTYEECECTGTIDDCIESASETLSSIRSEDNLTSMEIRCGWKCCVRQEETDYGSVWKDEYEYEEDYKFTIWEDGKWVI